MSRSSAGIFTPDMKGQEVLEGVAAAGRRLRTGSLVGCWRLLRLLLLAAGCCGC
jgi:hypothetical protein